MKTAIIECFEKLHISSLNKTSLLATGIKHNLESVSFNFWLDFFAKIIPKVEILFGQMQSRSMNSAFADAAIGCFTTAIHIVGYMMKLGSAYVHPMNHLAIQPRYDKCVNIML